MTIQHLNDCANELLRMKGVNITVSYHWYNSFFKRHPEVYLKFSRSIDCRRMNVEDPDDFIEWFRRFYEIRNKWGIIDSDIYNMDESGSVISME